MEWFADKWDITVQLGPLLMRGLWMTFKVSMLAIFLGSILGFFLGVFKTLGIRWLDWSINLYLHILRGSPYLVQLYIIYFVLPETGIAWLQFDSFTAAIVSLTIYTSSYVVEIVATAISAVPRGQDEAAQAVGMTKFQRLYHVVLPQALKFTIPPMASVYVIVIKSTSILSVIGISELTREGEIAILRMPGDIMYIYGLIALFYFVFCYPVLRFARWAETRVGTIEAH